MGGASVILRLFARIQSTSATLRANHEHMKVDALETAHCSANDGLFFTGFTGNPVVFRTIGQIL